MKPIEIIQKEVAPALDTIKEHCIANKLTISVAESVTAGALQLLLSTAPQAQQFFQGGITAYNLGQKATHLAIDPIYAENCNCVDDVISIEMAKNVCGLFRSQIGIGITGYATKVPELYIDELYAHIAIVLNDRLLHNSCYKPDTEKINAQFEYAQYIITILASILGKM